VSAHVRLLADDPSSVTFEDILDEYCVSRGVPSSEHLFLHFRREIQKHLLSPETSPPADDSLPLPADQPSLSASAPSSNACSSASGLAGAHPHSSASGNTASSALSNSQITQSLANNSKNGSTQGEEHSRPKPRLNLEIPNLRTDVYTDMLCTMVPRTILRDHMQRLGSSPEERWTQRRDFTRQLGTTIFQDYVLSIGHRFLHKFSVSARHAPSGGIDMIGGASRVPTSTCISQSELLPMVTSTGQISLIEVVPFRFTPNLQHYVTPIGVEGPLVSAIVACGRAHSRVESDLAEFLTVFVRDELLLWYLNYISVSNPGAPTSARPGHPNSGTQSQPAIIGEILENPLERLQAAGIDEKAFFGRVQQNCELILKRAQTLACIREEEQHATDTPVVLFQSILDLLSSAGNPQKLAQMDPHWHPWF